MTTADCMWDSNWCKCRITLFWKIKKYKSLYKSLLTEDHPYGFRSHLPWDLLDILKSESEENLPCLCKPSSTRSLDTLKPKSEENRSLRVNWCLTLWPMCQIRFGFPWQIWWERSAWTTYGHSRRGVGSCVWEIHRKEVTGQPWNNEEKNRKRRRKERRLDRKTFDVHRVQLWPKLIWSWTWISIARFCVLLAY